MDPELGPFHPPGLHDFTDRAFAAGQTGAPGLDLEKDDPPHLPLGQPIENHQVYRTPQEANVFRIVVERRQIWDQLLMDFAGGNGKASLNGIFPDSGCVPELPANHISRTGEHADDHSNRYAEESCCQWNLTMVGFR
jgi:hypothetical protein